MTKQDDAMPAQYLIIPTDETRFKVISIVYKKTVWTSVKNYFKEYRNFVAEVPTWDEAARIVEKMKEGGF